MLVIDYRVGKLLELVLAELEREGDPLVERLADRVARLSSQTEAVISKALPPAKFPLETSRLVDFLEVVVLSGHG